MRVREYVERTGPPFLRTHVRLTLRRVVPFRFPPTLHTAIVAVSAASRLPNPSHRGASRLPNPGSSCHRCAWLYGWNVHAPKDVPYILPKRILRRSRRHECGGTPSRRRFPTTMDLQAVRGGLHQVPRRNQLRRLHDNMFCSESNRPRRYSRVHLI